jgi:hypothetical protein
MITLSPRPPTRPRVRTRGHWPNTSKVIATVLETMDASNYTYVSVKADSGNWAASSQFTLAVGDTVVLFARPADGEFPEPGAQSRLSLDLFCVALRAARPRGGTR